MLFPENLASYINESTSEKLLEVLMLSGDTEEIDTNLKSWTVTSVSSSNIDVSLGFEKSIIVSAGTIPDVLLIQLFLDSYPDHNG